MNGSASDLRIVIDSAGLKRRVDELALISEAPNDERTMRNTGAVPCTYQVFRVTSERTPNKA